MKAIVIGATGATGNALTQLLLNNEHYQSVMIFVRKPVAITHPKLTVHLIDFDRPDTWADKVRGDVLFCCLGTTLKQAGSKDNQRKIDLDYPVNFAKIAKQNDIARFVVISSQGANAKSPLFYYRLKGELENALQAIGLNKLTIVRPPLLKREHSDRLGENLSEKILSFFNGLGLFQSAKPMPTDVLARAMIEAALQNKTGILEKEEIWGVGNININ
ncbi:NAD(P)H-binding protein [Moraxella sp. ZY210820]|uniref:NAD(P)H-binding protein n=1 Tax=unclassified Moraxella TaxID=2685852 RepID=UPI0027320209|nr:NAD(P)H-binding protein [Moraxella sp. ZY210820]WLF83353.1 NAD(P)H-binding protein [Moraxella sp. ZY210820]